MAHTLGAQYSDKKKINSWAFGHFDCPVIILELRMESRMNFLVSEQLSRKQRLLGKLKIIISLWSVKLVLFLTVLGRS